MFRAINRPILPVFVLLSITCRAQLMEFGAGFGSLSYAGDMARGVTWANQNFAAQGHCRINLSKVVSTKLSLTLGKISGDDTSPVDPSALLRQQSFSRSILEAAAVFEYHFLDYKNEKSQLRWSPYAFGGFGLFRVGGHDPAADDFAAIQPVLPFGVGLKCLAGKRFSVDLELGARRMFQDKIDGVSDGDVFAKDFQYGNPADSDWYHFVGISLSYIFWDIPCLYKYIPNKSIYD